jgi:hypothetical protein
VWEEKNILLPQNNRCCSVHLINGKFSSEALDEIVSNKSGVLMNDEQIAAWILELSTKPTNKYKKMLDLILKRKMNCLRTSTKLCLELEKNNSRFYSIISRVILRTAVTDIRKML